MVLLLLLALDIWGKITLLCDHISLAVSNEEERIDRKCSACERKEEEEEEANLNISRKPFTISNLEVGKEATKEINNIRMYRRLLS